MMSFSVRSLSGAASSLSASAVEVRPEAKSKQAASRSVAPWLQTAVRCHCCETNSPTVGPAACAVDLRSGVRALSQRARSKEDTVPTASKVPGSTTTRWLTPFAVIKAAASARLAVLSMSRGPEACCFFASQSAMISLDSSPSAKAFTASRGVTMP
mmetsp:Transcript_53343/g.173455  ORF Transcript_53343/g.173455 Transcript_53343/m.173455 type:complete len:156 (-) Transcript_53343:945-1412(-)